MNRIVLAGGTGFLGKYLSAQFRAAGDEVIIISRKQGDVQWQDRAGLIAALNGADLLINLAGKSVDCRYHEKNKRAILSSRVDTTLALGDCILQCSRPPRLWINSSTATIYRHAEDRPMTEEDGEIGSGFSVSVAQQWEQAFFSCHLPQTRQVALRMAIVLGRDGGVIKPLRRLVQSGLGGRQGTGQQVFSWIHIEDVFGIIEFIQKHEDLKGVFNASAPQPVTNEQLMQQLRNGMKQPVGLPAPAWLLRIGAVVIRTETELVLKSRWVVPERLLESGYAFRYPQLGQALTDILHRKVSK